LAPLGAAFAAEVELERVDSLEAQLNGADRAEFVVLVGHLEPVEQRLLVRLEGKRVSVGGEAD
jgi:hypothetical protein